MVRDTGGVALTATDDEIMAAQLELAETEGIWAEPAAALPLAVARKLAAHGDVAPGRGRGRGGHLDAASRIPRPPPPGCPRSPSSSRPSPRSSACSTRRRGDDRDGRRRRHPHVQGGPQLAGGIRAPRAGDRGDRPGGGARLSLRLGQRPHHGAPVRPRALPRPAELLRAPGRAGRRRRGHPPHPAGDGDDRPPAARAGVPRQAGRHARPLLRGPRDPRRRDGRVPRGVRAALPAAPRRAARRHGRGEPDDPPAACSPSAWSATRGATTPSTGSTWPRCRSSARSPFSSGATTPRSWSARRGTARAGSPRRWAATPSPAAWRACARPPSRQAAIRPRIAVAPQLICAIAPSHEAAVAKFRASWMYQHLRSLTASTLRDQNLARLEEYNLVGSPDELIERIGLLREAGVTMLAATNFVGSRSSEWLDDMQYFAEAVLRPSLARRALSAAARPRLLAAAPARRASSRSSSSPKRSASRASGTATRSTTATRGSAWPSPPSTPAASSWGRSSRTLHPAPRAHRGGDRHARRAERGARPPAARRRRRRAARRSPTSGGGRRWPCARRSR